MKIVLCNRSEILKLQLCCWVILLSLLSTNCSSGLLSFSANDIRCSGRTVVVLLIQLLPTSYTLIQTNRHRHRQAQSYIHTHSLKNKYIYISFRQHFYCKKKKKKTYTSKTFFIKKLVFYSLLANAIYAKNFCEKENF